MYSIRTIFVVRLNMYQYFPFKQIEMNILHIRDKKETQIYPTRQSHRVEPDKLNCLKHLYTSH